MNVIEEIVKFILVMGGMSILCLLALSPVYALIFYLQRKGRIRDGLWVKSKKTSIKTLLV
ncbi:hypothetical protein COB55_02180 [Candidatus Wolfebacteria bacterium]|nr:MAG: hypothetical protein COB55_02180 [Candidatus Wolfebacteria bacterium]